ncbi:MAG: hypothetical protein ACOYI5_03005 [Christensenellales bacterium]|jgi:hypothetical protein
MRTARRLLLALLALALAPLGALAEAEELPLAEILSANSLDGIFSRHTSFSLNTIYYDSSGAEVYSTYQAMSFADGARTAAFEDSGGYTEFLADELVYLYDPADQSFTVLAFYGDQYDRYIAMYEDYLFVYDSASEIVRVKAADGRTIAHVYVQRTEDNDAFFQSLGAGDSDALSIAYTLDPETHAVLGYAITALSGSKETLLARAFLSYSDTPIEPPAFVGELMQPKETREITVVFHDGNVKTYVIAREARFSMALPDGYDAYADAKGSAFASDFDHAGQDAKVYILPGE